MQKVTALGYDGVYDQGLNMTWVTNVSLPFNIDAVNQITSIIANNFGNVQVTTRRVLSGDSSIVWYNITTDKYIWSVDKSDAIASANSLIMDIAYYPLTMSAPFTPLISDRSLRISNLQEIIKMWLSHSRGFDITSFTINFFEDPSALIIDSQNMKLPSENKKRYVSDTKQIMTITPRTGKGMPIYMMQHDINRLMINVDLNDLMNYAYLTDSSLAPMLVSRTELNKTDIRFWNNIYLIPYKLATDTFITNFDLSVNGAIRSGHYVSPMNPSTFVQIHKSLKTIPELALLWNQQVSDISYGNDGQHDTTITAVINENPRYYLHNTIELGQSPNTWMQQSINQIERGQLPIFMMHNINWKLPYSDDNTLKLYYVAVRAMSQVINEYHLPLSTLDALQVMPNYSIKIMVASYSQALHVAKEIDLLLSPLTSSKIDSWTVYPVSDIGKEGLKTVALHRYYWQQLNPNLISLALQLENSGYYWLVIDTPTTARGYRQPTDDDVQELSGLLEEELQNYYSICEISQSLSGFFNATSAKLDDLLHLVPMSTGLGETQYCLTEDLLSELVAASSSAETQPMMDDETFRMFIPNPATTTNDQLSQTEVLRAMSRSLGLRGFFTVGKLNGLLPALPDYTQLQVDLGEILISPIDGGDYYAVEVAFFDEDALSSQLVPINNGDGYLIPLFQIHIADDQLSDVTAVINRLWRNGWFLSHWAKQVYILTGKMSRYIYANDPRLVLAEDSMSNSDKVISLLKRVNSHYLT